MDSIFESVIAKSVGMPADHPLALVMVGRGEVLRLSQASHDAALNPEPPGGLSHAERATLACRMARLNDEEILARHYEAMVPRNSELGVFTNPASGNSDDVRMQAILRHTDLVTTNPKNASQEDILALKSAGILEADIVRLSELIAFVSYQVRVIKGLRLMMKTV